MYSFNQLREHYKNFFYHGFSLKENDSEIFIEYNFEIEGLSSFKPCWRIKKIKGAKTFVDDAAFNLLAFNLGMVELISYWKITCSPNVYVQAGALNTKQISWWKKQYYNGLGEFFYINKIETDIKSFMTICAEDNVIKPKKASQGLEGCLIPVGGGKDSVVTLELLKGFVSKSCTYSINYRDSVYNESRLAGYNDSQIITAGRTLDKNMLELNAKGYLNGHTPFSAIVAFSSVMHAYVNGLKYVVLSNEASANESTVKDSEVNHQYSKSYDFERDFVQYEKEFINSGVYYFSLLRPLSEYQIAKYFASLKAYHKLFRSCNRASKSDSWCASCSKCLFVAFILSPFLTRKEITDIFNSDILDKAEMADIMYQLIGIEDEKPFECVGSRDEINFALTQAVNNYNKQGEKLPALLRIYSETEQYKFYTGQENILGSYYNSVHGIPEKFLNTVKESCIE